MTMRRSRRRRKGFLEEMTRQSSGSWSRGCTHYSDLSNRSYDCCVRKGETHAAFLFRCTYTAVEEFISVHHESGCLVTRHVHGLPAIECPYTNYNSKRIHIIKCSSCYWHIALLVPQSSKSSLRLHLFPLCS